MELDAQKHTHTQKQQKQQRQQKQKKKTTTTTHKHKKKKKKNNDCYTKDKEHTCCLSPLPSPSSFHEVIYRRLSKHSEHDSQRRSVLPEYLPTPSFLFLCPRAETGKPKKKGRSVVP
jgi:hypothetical protein